MNNSINLASTTSILTLLAALPAASQEFYVGLGLGAVGGAYDVRASNDDVFPSFTSVSGLAGVRFGANSYFYGAEIDVVYPTAEITECSDTFCGMNSTYRIKALVGREFAGFDVFASVGYAAMEGVLSPETDSSDRQYDGFTYSVGAQIPISESFNIRIEAIQDSFDAEEDAYVGRTWTNTTLRVAAIFTF